MLILWLIGCAIVSFLLCTVSYIIIDKRSCENSVAADETVASTEDTTTQVVKQSKINNTKPISLPYAKLTSGNWALLISAVVLTCMVAVRAVLLDGHWIDTFKLISMAIVLASAGIVDFYTKKIPNIYPLFILILRAVLLIFEFFFLRDRFVKLAVLAAVGIVLCFLIMLCLSLITKGGFGMGDVKLLSTACSMIGISVTLYTLTFGMFICMLTAIVLLTFKKKKMKDELPFGPYIFLGYVLAVMLGTL